MKRPTEPVVDSSAAAVLGSGAPEMTPSTTTADVSGLLPPPPSAETRPESAPVLNLFDVEATYGATPTRELIRSLFVLQTAQMGWLVRYAPTLYRWTQRVPLLRETTNVFIKYTFFRHFCGGETLDECRQYVERLCSRGVGAILDYSAEGEAAPMNATTVGRRRGDGSAAEISAISADEEHHERAARVLLATVQWAGRETKFSDTLSCLKLTALARFELLERISEALAARWGTLTTTHDGTPFLLLGHFDANGLARAVADSYEFSESEVGVSGCLASSVQKPSASISDSMKNPAMMPPSASTANQRSEDQLDSILDHVSLYLFNEFLSPEERLEFSRVLHRLDSVCAEARRYRIPMLIDAEQYSVQTAIDFCAGLMMLRHNRAFETDANTPTIVYSTVQSYLKDSSERLRAYRELGSRFRFRYGIKQVRGAYMASERRRAAAAGRPDLSPIHDTIDETHASYNAGLSALIDDVRAGHAAALFATHNVESLQRAVELVGSDSRLRQSAALRFAQLYGMGDSLTFGLSRAGFRSCKYVPFGRVDEVMPYLLRRLEENHSALGTAPRDISHFIAELRRRDLRAPH
jgi:proline dehydrogenase